MGRLPEGSRRHVARTTKWWTSRWEEAPSKWEPLDADDQAESPAWSWTCALCCATSNTPVADVAYTVPTRRGPVCPWCVAHPERSGADRTPWVGVNSVLFPLSAGLGVAAIVLAAFRGGGVAATVNVLAAFAGLGLIVVLVSQAACRSRASLAPPANAARSGDPASWDAAHAIADDPVRRALEESREARLDLWAPASPARLRQAGDLASAAIRATPWNSHVQATHALLLARLAGHTRSVHNAWSRRGTALASLADARSRDVEGDDASLDAVEAVVLALIGREPDAIAARHRAAIRSPELLPAIDAEFGRLGIDAHSVRSPS